jgi:hypothetical protein
MLVQFSLPKKKITELALSFPTLEKADGIELFDPFVLDVWACRYASSGGLWSARFILALWSGKMGFVHPSKPSKQSPGERQYPVDTYWKCGLFDIVNAMGTWDVPHRAAFAAWAREPWWP